ncbi:MAG: putative peptidoglycan glycosyltransferase FtsW [Clostridiales bacterium]|nr:putative peptidoglycan glycosyltransferase FtsW [Clostridiales bacterium]
MGTRLLKKFRKTRESGQHFFDYNLLFVIVFLSCFGLVMIYSSSYYSAQLTQGSNFYFVKKQAFVLAGGFIAMFVVSRLDYHKYVKAWWFVWIVSLILMILVNFTPLGVERNGKKRWIGFANHALFQPTELVKIALIVAMAVLIEKLIRYIDRWQVILLILMVSFPLGFLVLMNNLSSGLIIFGIVFAMYFVASRKKKRFVILIGAGVLLAAAAIVLADQLVAMNVLEPYQVSRILVWQNPEAYSQRGGYQVLQGLYAIGSGGLFGKGLGNSVQKLGFVPEAQNDMIFSIICEELGLFGAVCVILLFIFMLYRFLLIANNAPDLLGSMLVIGVMAQIAIQVFLNIAVVTNFIPNTGISLPFISYGGTSLMFLMMEMGMVLGVSRQIRFE